MSTERKQPLAGKPLIGQPGLGGQSLGGWVLGKSAEPARTLRLPSCLAAYAERNPGG
jgi:hypothetical protein